MNHSTAMSDRAIKRIPIPIRVAFLEGKWFVVSERLGSFRAINAVLKTSNNSNTNQHSFTLKVMIPADQWKVKDGAICESGRYENCRDIDWDFSFPHRGITRARPVDLEPLERGFISEEQRESSKKSSLEPLERY